jgi:hypothetical protein
MPPNQPFGRMAPWPRGCFLPPPTSRRDGLARTLDFGAFPSAQSFQQTAKDGNRLRRSLKDAGLVAPADALRPLGRGHPPLKHVGDVAAVAGAQEVLDDVPFLLLFRTQLGLTLQNVQALLQEEQVPRGDAARRAVGGKIAGDVQPGDQEPLPAGGVDGPARRRKPSPERGPGHRQRLPD